ncbi:hypothetical protein [Clostridium botulinum]|nr:hypothetical protein [Clostridium botulinum]MBY6773623.1 hypothetical protein [Clostridium botulinum]MBY6850342.1 hypothetical protein [Clostridium botulinum]MBY6857402.1 hypothetical protein [Clostridium botulinum]MBY6886057.1 hypothetical protein [Clostridium botulinum]MBY6967372.1 hypothetical protein [Clostridium botulinum]
MNMILDSLKKDLKTYSMGEGYYDRKTGEYKEPKPIDIDFKGAILPLSEKDLKYLEEGAYSLDDVKLYTDISMENNSFVTDIKENKHYKIYGVREYNIIDSTFKRYYMKRVEKING